MAFYLPGTHVFASRKGLPHYSGAVIFTDHVFELYSTWALLLNDMCWHADKHRPLQ